MDMQVFSSQRAWDVFRALQYGRIAFELMRDARHEIQPRSTKQIWNFFMEAANRRENK